MNKLVKVANKAVSAAKKEAIRRTLKAPESTPKNVRDLMNQTCLEIDKVQALLMQRFEKFDSLFK